MTTILVITGIVCHLIIYYTYRNQGKYREGMLFAVLLPESALLDPEIQHIQQQYSKKMKVSNRWMIASYIPLIALHSWTTFQLLYYIWWLIVIIFWLTKPFRQSLQATMALKEEHEWYVKPKQEVNGQLVDDDGDEYWSNGFTYHNTNDRRVLVPKRIGIGETINTATRTGKIIMRSTISITLLSFIFISFMLIRSEFNSPILEILEGDTIAINYPMYSTNMFVEDIVDISLVNDYPKVKKINGEATKNFLRGQFNSSDLGKIKMYIFKNNPPYIEIQLKSGYVFYNDQDPEMTKQWYEELLLLHNSS
ncbi:DUF5808 domain-containing protein [Paenibacillus endoradicis]|uniref:DUF5808 domain-containing protein n=1 Tax=Paenibacillus endoradicis TaxID=2972487 RepID=UPI002159475C|nr:DUF5808 domain-containing protein [Paenibacillus endoradicis]MCR8658490.1 DUF5808 domain-containing protein [Paenibacillus endoradicis]